MTKSLVLKVSIQFGMLSCDSQNELVLKRSTVVLTVLFNLTSFICILVSKKIGYFKTLSKF